MKVLLTGAHFTPAQAVIEQLLKDPSIEIVYIGRKTTIEGDKTPSVESQILPKLGIKFLPITTGRLRRFISPLTFLSLLKIPVGFVQALYYLLKIQPDVVLSFGGYVGVPVVVVAYFLSIPVMLHEQTLVSGLANNISSWFASKIAVSYSPEKYGFDKDKMVLTGNPIRMELLEENPHQSALSKKLAAAKKEKLKVLYVTGGNQGSHLINTIVEQALKKLTQKKWFVIHQTGDSSYNDYERLSKLDVENYTCQKWFGSREVADIFRHADLVVSRAGANTLMELAYFCIPTIVVPIPYLSKDEQNTNAKFYQKLGLCRILAQKDISSEKLIDLVDDIQKDYSKAKKSAEDAKSVVISDAASRLALEVRLLAASQQYS